MHVALILIVSRSSCIWAWQEGGRRAWGPAGHTSWAPSYTPFPESLPRDLYLCLLGLWLQGVRKKDNFNWACCDPDYVCCATKDKGKAAQEQKFKMALKLEFYTDTRSISIFPFWFYGLICHFNVWVKCSFAPFYWRSELWAT